MSTPNQRQTSFIQRLEVESYGCIKKASFQLTRLHALIGPNDSGKSTVLRALRTVGQFASDRFSVDEATGILPFDPMLGDKFSKTKLRVTLSVGASYALEKTEEGLGELVFDARGRQVLVARPRKLTARGALHQPPTVQPNGGERRALEVLPVLRACFGVPHLLRLDPDALRSASPLLLEGKAIAFFDERGTGLASVLDAFINRNFEAYTQTQEAVRRLFPSVAQIGLRNVRPEGDKRETGEVWKAIDATLMDGTRVPAAALSEGLLYFLAFTVLQHIEPTTLLLIEEPENGLHPSRIADVIAVLREISKKSQVVIATHSPLVINELKGEEISVITRTPKKGTEGILLKDVPGFDDASKVYLPGEFWVSYADGKMEEPLLSGQPRQ
jgi:ABC-type uncharacterized transport system ATPase subunit